MARLVPHKGQDVALRALAALARDFPDLRYLLVGEGHDRQRLEALARELGVADRVVFAGVLSDDEIAEAYATATLYLGLSRIDNEVDVEGFGISFIEAAASGVPAVAGDSGGVRSAVRDGETGLVVPPTDVEAVTAAVRAAAHRQRPPQRDGRRGAPGRRNPLQLGPRRARNAGFRPTRPGETGDVHETAEMGLFQRHGHGTERLLKRARMQGEDVRRMRQTVE